MGTKTEESNQGNIGRSKKGLHLLMEHDAVRLILHIVENSTDLSLKGFGSLSLSLELSLSLSLLNSLELS